MDSNNQIILGFVISLIGTAFGWFLNQASDLWMQSREKKRKLKTLIFYLLELYQLLIKSDYSKFSDRLIDKILKKIKDPNLTAENKGEIKKLFSVILAQNVTPLLQKDFDAIKENYENSIKELATIDPIRAYYLKGKNEIVNKFDLLPGIMEQLKTIVPDNFDQVNEKVQVIFDSTREKFLKEAAGDIENEILELARIVGLFQWWRIKGTLNRIKTTSDLDTDRQIKDLLNQFQKIIG
jgi:hypothetical protein